MERTSNQPTFLDSLTSDLGGRRTARFFQKCDHLIPWNELGEPDDSGRRRPIAIAGSEFRIDVDAVIVAIGNIANPLIRQTTPGLEFNKWGNIVVDENCKTSLEGVYAGGDIVLGAATVILAMGQGRIAAAAINEYLSKKL